MSKSVHPAVVVLVCTRDRRAMLDALLADLRAQDYDGKHEIIVVEETDDPRPPEGVNYVPHPVLNKGIAFARNLAIEHAAHDLIVFVDDDCRVETDWLRRLVRPLDDPQLLGVQGG
ncbi:MAG: glycosyltransferase family A protein, partial [Mariprofundaceae bacterium]|nr:glycosyltransferase family A protein [Mariprofundaceae bacterium]